MKTYTLYLFFLLFSCSTQQADNIEKQKYAIINTLVENFGLPNPPVPPPPPEKIPSLKEMGWDSIKKLDQKIGLYSKIEYYEEDFPKNPIYGSVFNQLLDSLKLSNGYVFNLQKDKINVIDQFHVHLVDTTSLKSKQKNIDKTFDKVITISNLYFNKDFSKALVTVGVMIGKLNGYSSLVFLEKKSNVWKIKNAINYSIS